MNRLKKILLIVVTAIALVLIIYPMKYFIRTFSSSEISSDMTNWGAFGDYYFGTINSIIALASLCVLGYITWLISKNSILANKKLHDLERKRAAYDNLMEYIPKVNLIDSKLSIFLSGQRHMVEEIDRQLEDLSNAEEITKEEINIIKERQFLANREFLSAGDIILEGREYQFFIKSFSPRYRNLFRYNFDSDEYKEFNESVRIMTDNLDSFYRKLLKREYSFDGTPSQNHITNHAELLTEFVNSLHEEIVEDSLNIEKYHK